MLRTTVWGSSARWRAWLLGGLAVTLVALGLHFLLNGSPGSVAFASANAVPSKHPHPMSEKAWIRRTIRRMTLREKVGQLFEVNGYGASATDTSPGTVRLNRAYYGVDNIAQLIRKFHPGGIIYFAWTNNLQNPTQIATLSNQIQSVALHDGASVPDTISTDQEGGEVIRIGSPAAVFPGNMALGATRSTTMSTQAGFVMGRELRAMGINIDNAPVVDVNVEPQNEADGIRAYGDQVPLVSDLGAAEVRGFQSNQATRGEGATAKHWPGFGAAKENSDFSVAISPQTLAEVKETNVPPFKAAMRAGLDRVMVTHLLFPNITGHQITSLSRYWVDGFLRKQVHYNGPVVTDALDAAALKSLSPTRIALDAINAGDDQLLEVAQCTYPNLDTCAPGGKIPNDGTNDPAPGDLVPAYNAVLHAVQTHRISEKRLEESLTRILDLKWKLGLIHDPYVDVANVPKVVGAPQHLAIMQTIADRSITLIKNDDHLLPLSKNSGKRVLITGSGQDARNTIASDIQARGLTPDVSPTHFTKPTDLEIAAAVAKAHLDDLVIVDTFNAWGDPQQRKLVNDLLAVGKPVILNTVGTPYDIAYFSGVRTFITAYSYQAVSMHPLVKVMFGELRPTGRLPVSIVLYPFGYGLG